MKKFVIVNIMMGINQGGGENFDLNLIRELKARGHEVELVYLHPLTFSPRKPLPTGVKLTPLYSPWLYPLSQRLYKYKFLDRFSFLKGLPRFIGQTLFELRAFFYLSNNIVPGNTYVHTCGLTFLSHLTWKFLRVKTIIRLPGPVKYGFEKRNLRGSFRVIANGSAYERTRAQISGLSNLRYIEVGLDQDTFRPQDKTQIKKELGFSAGLFHLLYVGRLVSIKNIPMILRALSIRPLRDHKVQLHLVGEGDLRPELQRLANELGVASIVTFHPPCDKLSLSKYYNAADVLLLTSTYENFSNAIIEAMASGLPVIATAVGGNLVQISPGEDGFLVESDDYVALSRTLLGLCEGVENARELGKKAFKKVVNLYNWSSSIEKYLELYECD